MRLEKYNARSHSIRKDVAMRKRRYGGSGRGLDVRKLKLKFGKNGILTVRGLERRYEPDRKRRGKCVDMRLKIKRRCYSPYGKILR